MVLHTVDHDIVAHAGAFSSSQHSAFGHVEAFCIDMFCLVLFFLLVLQLLGIDGWTTGLY